MGDHHPFGCSCRAGRIDQVGQIFAGHAAVGVRVGCRRDARIGIGQNAGRTVGNDGRNPFFGDDDLRLTVGGIEGDAVRGIVGIEGHIGAPRFQNGQRGDHHVFRPSHMQAHGACRADAHLLQHVGQPVGAGVELAIAQGRVLEDQSRFIRYCSGLGFERGVCGDIGRIVLRGVVEAFDQLSALGLRQKRQVRARRVIGNICC